MYSTEEIFGNMHMEEDFAVPYPYPQLAERAAGYTKHIAGFHDYSLSDYVQPCSIVFMKHCPYSCPHCHNRNIARGKQSLDADFGFVFQRLTHFRAVSIATGIPAMVPSAITISGGEPTMSPVLVDIVKLFKELQYRIKIDTMGYNWSVIDSLLPIVDSFYIDIKGPWSKYPDLVGRDVDIYSIQAGFRHIFRMAVQYPEKFVFRTTVVPELTQEDVQEVHSYVPKTHTLKLQKFRSPNA